LPWTPMAKASSVRNSERSPGSPPAVTLSTVPDANPAARLSDRPDDPKSSPPNSLWKKPRLRVRRGDSCKMVWLVPSPRRVVRVQ
jgi:hypothetical protein